MMGRENTPIATSVYLYRKYSVEIDTINSASPSAAHSFYPAGANGTLDDIESGQATTPSTLPFWELVSGLFVLTVLCFCIFLRLINKEYRCTFYDTRTGCEFLIDNWRNGISDKERFYIFSKQKMLYKSINKELKDWLSDNWERWEEEKEDWFTAKMIGKIPSELLPDKLIKELGGIKKARNSIRMSVLKEEKEVEVEKVRRASAAQVVPSG